MKAFIDTTFIFSDERKYRVMRHLLFWFFWILYIGMTRFLSANTYKKVGHFDDPLIVFIESFFLVLPHTVLVYPMLYFILPRYIITGKYFRASLWVILFLILTTAAATVLFIFIPWEKAVQLSPNLKLFKEAAGNSWQKMTISYRIGMNGSIIAAALAASVKLFKHYYLKNHRIQQLMKENIAAQLQILRAQVHPHFLFNTLNNIFSQTQTESPKGSKMIMGLSDTLRYILYEGQKPLVPLNQELMMLSEYIKLEKIRYGNKIDVHVLMPDKTDDIYIAPLLLLPFIENCFKHGTSNLLQNPWVNLAIEMIDTRLEMKLMNGKTALPGNDESKPGIGISKVRQRLDLLYKDKYDLQITEDEEVFIVDLSIALVNVKDQVQSDRFTQTQSTIAYA
ncbi:MAG TPA: histidine kinase [Chitinophagaceae bacterium]|nr:histidine kinase [Chitinophagaceae bacterium]